MSRFKWIAPIVVAAGALFLAAFAAPPPAASDATKGATWGSDLAAATRQARAAGKDVLVEFSTVDAAAGPPRLDRVVYDDARFLRAAAERFVPVRLTVRTGGAGPSADVAVVALAERLAVSRVPSLVLMDSSGRPYAAVDSDAESVEAQLSALFAAAAERTRRDDAFTRADQASGPERAARLHDALQHVGRFALAGYESSVVEIVALDRDNALKLKEKYHGPLSERRIDRAVQQIVYPLVDRADFTGAVAAIDQLLAAEAPPAAQAQTLLAFKGQLLFSANRTDEARRTLDQALALAPTSDAAARVTAARRQMDE